MLKKLEKRQYPRVGDLRADIDLIWNNAITFNGTQSWIYKVGARCWTH